MTSAPTWGGTRVLGAEPRSTLEAGRPLQTGPGASLATGPRRFAQSRDGPSAWRLHAGCRVPAGARPRAGLRTCGAGQKGPPGRSGRHERLLVQGRGQDVLAIRRELHKGHRGVVVICVETGGLTRGRSAGASAGAKRRAAPLTKERPGEAAADLDRPHGARCSCQS